ncbi:unnamed protein product [Vitrella brassicaformis CCMP3155]|uniref:Uncharacterized protein n=1 Tax=Vitrella brassicaformis (strain CCMP3155) TaxID=1169540 RepID=A0A0G4EET9_VITBC|nr:unnamed protein product [Vitrella brassicaformis CCMP3155]|eukprot:CEL94526.1 unnamed protein product [Vitrella brassicaformis CCMP3155]
MSPETVSSLKPDQSLRHRLTELGKIIDVATTEVPISEEQKADAVISLLPMQIQPTLKFQMLKDFDSAKAAYLTEGRLVGSLEDLGWPAMSSRWD